MAEVFVFLVPLIGKDTSPNWSTTCALCRNTVASMLAGGPAVRIVLVCNEIPDGLPDDERISIISLPPKKRESFGQRMHDKDLKILHGLTHVRHMAPCWLMLADADDLVSARLVPFVLERGGERDGWFVEDGWGRSRRTGGIFAIRNFHRVCGTSFILRVRPDDLPRNAEAPPQQETLSGIGHNALVDHFRSRGLNMATVPFRAVVYNIETGVNSTSGINWKSLSSIKRLLRIMLTRPVTREIRREFCIE